jgi:hypothetical protein
MSRFEHEELEAAWWRETLVMMRLRQSVASLGLGGAAVLAGGCFGLHSWAYDEPQPQRAAQQQQNDEDRSVHALTLQRVEGWDVGNADRPLALAGATMVDIDGSQAWRGKLDRLFSLLLPSRSQLIPYYVPTLFQALVGPGGDRLQSRIQPVHTPAMDDDLARGLAVRSLFEQAGWPTDTAIVLDAPGPRAVAVAAGLADRFDPVFTFGNWPHPLGVVPAQDTLGAVLYYLPMLEGAKSLRPAQAPPLFVLDSNRLLPYGDADTQFDNRYIAKIPSAAQLKALGVKHVLLVNTDGQQELDDLNHALVDLTGEGVDVKVVALSDFTRDQAPASQPAGLEMLAEEDSPEDAAFYGAAWPDWAVDSFWYGGCPGWHVGFWGSYGGWYRPPRWVWFGKRGHRRAVEVQQVAAPHGKLSNTQPMALHRRPTIFDGLGPRRPAPPMGFGHVAVRASRADGSITSVRAGGHQPHASSGRWGDGARSYGGGGGHAASYGGRGHARSYGGARSGGSHSGFFGYSRHGGSRSYSGGRSGGGRSGSFGRAGGGRSHGGG